MTKKDPISEPSYGIWGRKDQLIFATFLQSVCCFLFLSLYSYVADMSTMSVLGDISFPSWLEANWMGKVGGYVAHYLLKELCGISALAIPLIPFCISLKLFSPQSRYSLVKTLLILIFLMVWSTLAISYWHYVQGHKDSIWYILPSRLSIKIAIYLGDLLGGGVVLLLVTSLISFFIMLTFDSLFAFKEQLNETLYAHHAKKAEKNEPEQPHAEKEPSTPTNTVEEEESDEESVQEEAQPEKSNL